MNAAMLRLVTAALTRPAAEMAPSENSSKKLPLILLRRAPFSATGALCFSARSTRVRRLPETTLPKLHPLHPRAAASSAWTVAPHRGLARRRDVLFVLLLALLIFFVNFLAGIIASFLLIPVPKKVLKPFALALLRLDDEARGGSSRARRSRRGVSMATQRVACCENT